MPARAGISIFSPAVDFEIFGQRFEVITHTTPDV